MRPTIAALSLALLLTTGCRQEDPQPQPVFQPKFNFLTRGDADSGRQAFADLKCNTCHGIVGGEAFQKPILPGPELGDLQSKESALELADSIVVPSHVVPGQAGLEHSVSSMGDYSRVMTVKQLMDLIAFVQQLPE